MATEKIFAIGDVHGCLEQLQEIVESIPLDSSSELVFLGDYVDRGPQSKEVIEYLIDLKKQFNVVCLRGNHEQMMMDFIENPASVNAGLFILNGGGSTLASYEVEDGQYTVPDHHIEFLQQLPYTYQTEHFFFVHAGVPDISLRELDESLHKDDFLWIRDSFLHNHRLWEKTIVHGHTVFEDVQIMENRISLDTGCVFSGALSAMELFSGQVYQVPVIEPIQYRPLKEAQNSTRRAARFSGNIPVTVNLDDGPHTMTCLNYNEFGLLITERSPNYISAHEEISGYFGSTSNQPIEFHGKVVRSYKNDGEHFHGVEFTVPLKSLNF